MGSFFGISAVNSKKNGECETPKNDSRYCHALCKEGFFPPAGYETTSKMTKITCQCNEEENSCQWVPDKPFVGCVGPCKQPIRSFENIDLFFKVKTDYSEASEVYGEQSDSLHTVFRVTNKTPLSDGWTLAIQFAEPQKFAIQSADVDFSWNCKYTILTARPKKFNFALNAKKSHSFLALIEGATRDQIENQFKMFLYAGIIKPDETNCLDADFGPDYCPDKVYPTKPYPTRPGATKPEMTKPNKTKPSMTKPEMTMPDIIKEDMTKPDITKPDMTKPDKIKPDMTKPDMTKPGMTKPDMTKPDMTKPDKTKPEKTKPDTGIDSGEDDSDSGDDDVNPKRTQRPAKKRGQKSNR